MIMTFLGNDLVILPVLIPLTGALIALALRRWSPCPGGVGAGDHGRESLRQPVLALDRLADSGAPMVFQAGGWRAPFGITFVADLLSVLFVVMTQLVMVTGLLYALGSKDKVIGYSTFYPLFLTLATGLTGTFLTGDLFNMFVFAELLVISGTVLTAASDDRYRHRSSLQVLLYESAGFDVYAVEHRLAVRLLWHAQHGRSRGTRGR